MDEGEFPYNHGEDAKGQDMSVGNAETKTNGHRENVNPREFVETMRSLRMEVQSYREDNERLLKAQEQQNELNTQLVQSLNMLQRQMKMGSTSIEEEEGRRDSRKRSHEKS